MLTIVSFILIIICLALILSIVLKKFPALAILNVADMPAEKEAKFKEQLLRQKVERDLSRVGGTLGRVWLFLANRWARFLERTHSELKKTKQSYRLGLVLPYAEKQKRIKELKLNVEETLKKEDLATTEEKLIEIISLDQKNLNAFFRLAGLYADERKWPEARQTYKYALKLARQHRDDETVMNELSLPEIYFSLARMEKDCDNLDAALENTREALDLEPNNPRFLDLILDLSIMKKDKALAQETWQKLAAVNPENNKLAAWQEQIEGIEE